MKKDAYNYAELVTRGRIDYPDCRTYLCNNDFFFYYDEEYECLDIIGHLKYDVNDFFIENCFQWENDETFKPVNIEDYPDVTFSYKYVSSITDDYEVFPLSFDDLKKIDGLYIDNEYQVFYVNQGEPITNKKIGTEFALIRPFTNETAYTYIDPQEDDNDEEFPLDVCEAQGLPPKSIYLSSIGLVWQVLDNKKKGHEIKLIGSIYFDINDYPEAKENWFNYDPLAQNYKVLYLGNRKD